MLMIETLGGRTYRFEEVRALLEAAGFERIERASEGLCVAYAPSVDPVPIPGV
jgi:hypothetical protein